MKRDARTNGQVQLFWQPFQKIPNNSPQSVIYTPLSQGINMKNYALKTFLICSRIGHQMHLGSEKLARCFVCETQSTDEQERAFGL